MNKNKIVIDEVTINENWIRQLQNLKRKDNSIREKQREATHKIQAICLRLFLKGITYKEIGEIVGVSVSRIRQHIWKGRSYIRWIQRSQLKNK